MLTQFMLDDQVFELAGEERRPTSKGRTVRLDLWQSNFRYC